MEWIDTRLYPGHYVNLHCGRCGNVVPVGVKEEYIGSGPGSSLRCGDCQQWEKASPVAAEAEFQASIRRSEQDSVAMRARWAAQDAIRGHHS